MIKKIFVSAAVVLLLLAVPACVFAAGGKQTGSITIMMNGSEMEASAYVNDGVLYLPLRAIGESLGYEIRWAGEENAVSALKDGESVIIDLKNHKITVNDHACFMGGDYLGIPAASYMMIKDRTYMRADLFADFDVNVRWDEQSGKVMLQSVKRNPITIKTMKQESEDDVIKTTIQYPQIDGLEDKAVQGSINTIFEKEALAAGDEGRRNAEEMKELRLSGLMSSLNRCETYFDYSIKYNQNGLLSVVFMNYQYTGGAHGSTIQKSYTLDLDTGEVYELEDLMKGESDYASFISGIVRSEIDERAAAGALTEIAAFNAIRDDQAFYLSDSALVVYFQQYEYFPYAAGIQVFPIEYSGLRELLKPDFCFLSF